MSYVIRSRTVEQLVGLAVLIEKYLEGLGIASWNLKMKIGSSNRTLEIGSCKLEIGHITDTPYQLAQFELCELSKLAQLELNLA